MSNRLRIYIAGPITKGPLAENIKQATDAAMRLLKAGFGPLCPHLSCYMGGPAPAVLPGDTTHEDWYEADMPWVAVSDAVLRLPGESVGADKETALAQQLGIPVYTDVEMLIASPPPKGDPRFHDVLRQMGLLHNRKGADYGTDEDVFANVRASQEWGVAPWLGAMLRGGDKVKRLKTFAKKGTLANEGVEDSMLDLANYAVIALVLYRESGQT